MQAGPSKEELRSGAAGISRGLSGFDASLPRPANIRHLSSPTYKSPLRHHQRKASTPRHVKETLHAHSEYTNSEDDGAAVHRINQYTIKQEIGRGSFGAVHLAVDQYGTEYAVKEFSKSRLRKRAQSNILRRPHARPPQGHLVAGHLVAGREFNPPLHRHSSSDMHDQGEEYNPLYLIREEIAIMKKLNHDNLVSLYEVLDDPDEDSLYMVMEMCKKGVVMKVGMSEQADPYDAESCRCWFRDLILGIEYLHAQGVAHRDIKPDNCLLTEDDVLKVVDFGVSEMFEKSSDMMTAKSAGSPAFLPPELCVPKHGGVSGKAVDIWSMGATLYCLYFGRVPFERMNVLDLCKSIREDDLSLERGTDPDFADLMRRIMEKDPAKRIQMTGLREHRWVTKGGADPLLSEAENTADLVEPPTEEEVNRAITGNMSNLLVVVKAVKRFKALLSRKRQRVVSGLLGQSARFVQPPLSMQQPQSRKRPYHSHSLDTSNRRPLERALVVEGVHRSINPMGMDQGPSEAEDGAVQGDPQTIQNFQDSQAAPQNPGSGSNLHVSPEAHGSDSGSKPHASASANLHHRGQAHDPLDENIFLEIGPGGNDAPPDPPAVSESPSAADGNIYEVAYFEEVERIQARRGKDTTLYLTRQVGRTTEYQEDEN